MDITTLIDNQKQNTGTTAFTFEVLPPLKGTGIGKLFDTIETLREFDPKFINITTHHSEYVYTDLGNGLFQAARIRRRPGTVAVAAAIQQKFGIPVVPHILCSGFTREETEYVLLDLQFLGISNVLALRGDKAKEDRAFKPTSGGYSHTTELLEQISRFNEGYFIDGSPIQVKGEPFSCGVACYPEKHEEAPNMETDLQWLKRKVELGAKYAVTQLFYDNGKFFSFVERARQAGIDVPIIPGIKPFTKLSQLTVLPKTFHCDMPETLTREALKCKTDDEARQVGIEWGVQQCRELMRWGAPSIHFYTMSAVSSIKEIAKQIY
jgi:methylenetetrahydrofolate reductase (NADPH)